MLPSERFKHSLFGIFPPLPEITLPGWYLIRRDNFLSVQGNAHAVTRFSLMERNTQRGYADLLFLPAKISGLPERKDARVLTRINVQTQFEGQTFETQLLQMVQDYLTGMDAIGLLHDTTSFERANFFRKNGWEKIPGTKKQNWKSFNAAGIDPKQLVTAIENSTLYLIDYERAVRNIAQRRRSYGA